MRPACRQAYELRFFLIQQFTPIRVRPDGLATRRRFRAACRIGVGQGDHFHLRAIIENYVESVPVIAFTRVADERRAPFAAGSRHRRRDLRGKDSRKCSSSG